MPINLIRFQSGLSIPKFFKQFGIEVPYTAILEKVLCCSVQVDNAYFNGELRSDSVDRGSENKMCVTSAISLNDEGHPLQAKLTPAPFIADGATYNLSFDCLMLSDGLARFDAIADADFPHRPISIDRVKPKYFPHFVWINNLSVRLKTSLGGVYHAFDFSKYASRCPVPFPNCFSRRFDLKTFRECPPSCYRHNYQFPNRFLALFG